MSANLPQHNPEDQEIDLTQIYKKIRSFFEGINTVIFKCIRFFFRNAIVIVILLIVGVGLGMFLDETQKTYDHQIIVAPNFKSTDYLYSKIELLTSKIAEKDTFFLKSIGIKKPLEVTKISIEPIVDVYKLVSNNEQNFELLELMAQNGDLKTVVKETTTSKNYNYHTIVISTNGITNQNDIVKPILDYVNTSGYFGEVQKISVEFLQQKLQPKEGIIVQIDAILSSFSNGNATNKSDKLIYYNENIQLNNIIKTKDSIVNVLGTLKIDLLNSRRIINENAISLNIKNNKSINGKRKVIIPILFISLFIFIRFFMSFYRKQSLKAE